MRRERVSARVVARASIKSHLLKLLPPEKSGEEQRINNLNI